MAKKKKTFIQEMYELSWWILAVLLIRSFVFQPFSIPSGSMYPTLMVGDYLIVNKFAYGYSKYSILLGKNLPDFRRIWADTPKQGDVIVFREKHSGLDYIKRLIGMPGDTIQLVEGRLYINGKIVQRERLQDTLYDGRMVRVYKETLPNGRQHRIYETAEDRGQLDNTPVYRVPKGHYFMMGDNRDESGDSRTRMVGPIAFDALIGPAKVVFMSFEGGILGGSFRNIIQPWKWGIYYPRTKRFFTKIQ